jgi:hypothetical protein
LFYKCHFTIGIMRGCCSRRLHRSLSFYCCNDRCRRRGNGFPDLFVKAYANGFKETFNLDRQTAVTVIRSAENEFRKSMVSYGLDLAQETAVAQGLIADQLAGMGIPH